MSEDLLQQTADAIFVKACTSERIDACASTGWDPTLWATLTESGLTTLSVSEGSLLDAATVVRSAAAHSAMVPLAEHIVAASALRDAGLAIPDAPLSFAMWDGKAHYGRIATVVHLWPSDAGQTAVLQREVMTAGRNLAREPRDLMAPGGEVLGAVAASVLQDTLRRAALLRAVMLSGVAERALELTVSYVREREAFGRPIAQFQAVQQQVAQMAAEVALMRACADAAVLAAESGGVSRAELEIAAAMATCAASAGAVARIAHQMHGAIGYTYEHVLRHSTLRLWSWRDECGGEQMWSQVIGAHARAAGSDGLWPLLAGI